MARSRKHPWSAASGVVVLFASSLLPAQDGERAQPGSRAPVATNGAAPRNADDEFFPRNPTRCISTTRLDRTEVVDNETVLFYMRGGDIYRNRLSRSCPGLEREKRFTYRVYGNQLCRVDTITVLESRAFGLSDGFTCALGDFQPISVDEAERLTGEFWPADVEVEAIELPEEEHEEGSEPGDDAAGARGDAASGAADAEAQPRPGDASEPR